MENFKSLSGLRKCRNERPQVCITSFLLRFISTLFIVVIVSCSLFAQHLFSVEYGGLTQDRANVLSAEVARRGSPVCD